MPWKKYYLGIFSFFFKAHLQVSREFLIFIAISIHFRYRFLIRKFKIRFPSPKYYGGIQNSHTHREKKKTERKKNATYILI